MFEIIYKIIEQSIRKKNRNLIDIIIFLIVIIIDFFFNFLQVDRFLEKLSTLTKENEQMNHFKSFIVR